MTGVAKTGNNLSGSRWQRLVWGGIFGVADKHPAVPPREAQMRVIITDLTRFSRPDILCTAAVSEDGMVVRPLPYLTSAACKQHNILPGGILEGEFTLKNAARPHVEDADHKNLRFLGKCSGDEFRAALESTLYESISEGFECEVTGKGIPEDSPPPRSLITIKVRPDRFTVEKDGFDADKLRGKLTDSSGLTLTRLSITDVGFFHFAKGHAATEADLARVTRFIRSQEELYVRIGLCRPYKGMYWLQLNGIYTFPDYLKAVRAYT
jgi:hypothetical protein